MPGLEQEGKKNICNSFNKDKLKILSLKYFWNKKVKKLHILTKNKKILLIMEFGNVIQNKNNLSEKGVW